MSAVSSLTVGLGDIFLEPEVMRLTDVLVFSLAILTSFVLLSAFLGKISELVGRRVVKKEPNFSEKFIERLEKTNVFPAIGRLRKRRPIVEAITSENT